MPRPEATGAHEGTADDLERGRLAYARREWLEAYRSLSRADGSAPLPPAELEQLATAAYMLGRDDDQLRLLERAHTGHLDAGDHLRAARCAFWIGNNLAGRGQRGPAGGWFARAQRLVGREDDDCAEAGYVLLPLLLQQAASGDATAAYETATAAAAIADRFAEADLLALAVMGQGRALLAQGRVDEGLARLDEAMVAVTTGELSPPVTGLVYCGLITGCRQVHDVRRAQEWTSALTTWCDEQPDLVVYTGECLLHRAEVMQLRGAWPEALDEAQRAGVRFSERISANRSSAAQAFYRQGELRRLRGELAAAEEAYRRASALGCEPQPGLALLRLAQGEGGAAAAAIARAVGEATEPATRAGLLSAAVEILLAVGEHEAASRACAELDEIVAAGESTALGAMGAEARGALQLARGDAWAALVPLRRAVKAWEELQAPYEEARVRVLVGEACRSLGDVDSATLELDAAQTVFRQLGAGLDLRRVERLLGREVTAAGGLTPRELEVLRLVAGGRTNRAIAAELVISEKTVARHMSNVFTKLGVGSRSAATAYAYEHHLV
jgi:DNA-binding CsgD family transcriptional regulator